MRGVKAFTGAAASALLLALHGPDARSWPTRSRRRWCAPIRTIRSSMRSARRCASPTRTCRRRCRAIARRSRSPRAPAINIPIRSAPRAATPNTLVTHRYSRRQCAAQRRRHRHADAVQRPADREQDQSGGEPGFRRARSLARARTDRPAQSAATIYMDYLRDSAIVEVQKSNVRVLEQTLKQTRDRFNVGEVTRTDVAQSEAQLAAGRTQLLTAEANLTTTRSNFRRIIGNEPASACAGLAGRSLPAVDAAGRRRTRPDAKSERHRGDVRHRRQLSPGQGGRRRAVADGHAPGLGAAVL